MKLIIVTDEYAERYQPTESVPDVQVIGLGGYDLTQHVERVDLMNRIVAAVRAGQKREGNNG